MMHQTAVSANWVLYFAAFSVNVWKIRGDRCHCRAISAQFVKCRSKSPTNSWFRLTPLGHPDDPTTTWRLHTTRRDCRETVVESVVTTDDKAHRAAGVTDRQTDRRTDGRLR